MAFSRLFSAVYWRHGPTHWTTNPRAAERYNNVDICFYSQSEHSNSNTTHSFIFYSMFRQFVAAIIRWYPNNV